MAGHSKFTRLAERRALQAASGALRRFHDDFATSRKADSDWTPRQVVGSHRDALGDAVRVLTPIISDRVRAGVAYDNECKAEAYPYNGPGQLHPSQRIGEPPLPSRGAAGELETFKSAVSDVLATSPDSETARRRVQALLATEATRLSIFRKR